MLFSSTEFLFAFLPATLAGFYLAGRLGGPRIALMWLTAASLFFYGYWNPVFLPLIAGSIICNYALGRAIVANRSKPLLITGIVFNLSLLSYYKYTDFLIGTINMLGDASFPMLSVVLPLAISFFTFQQIAYLADAYQGRTHDPDFLHYCLFVSFFPQLIAGPIVHHSETIPQFQRSDTFRINRSRLAVGLTIIFMGLYKKVMLADGIAAHADKVFDSATTTAPGLIEAWGGALAYSFQIYFDFSGYSDMAIGAAFLFGIRLPINFNSPYKAVNIIDFWRRWHITLSRFIRDYLYYPLGGNRKGPKRRYANLMTAMILGGLWHGAAWNFVFWGGLHGFYLAINHFWHAVRRRMRHDISTSTPVGRWIARLITFISVVIAWVFFRAESWEAALAIIGGMANLNGVGECVDFAWRANGAEFAWLGILLAVVWLAPNSQELMAEDEPVLDSPPPSRIPYRAAWITPAVAVVAVIVSLVMVSRGPDGARFIYMIF
jgi:alginate O-acetyltransferase complex protein AlgI